MDSVDLESVFRDLARSPDLKPFRELIEPLIAYDDRRRRGDLVRTLSVFFASKANVSDTADRLFLHRNSVLYRLARIQELTGLDLRDPRARLALQLGLLAIEGREGNSDAEAEHA